MNRFSFGGRAVGPMIIATVLLSCGEGSKPLETNYTQRLREVSCEYLARCHPDAMIVFPNEDMAVCKNPVECVSYTSIRADDFVDPEGCIELLKNAECVFPLSSEVSYSPDSLRMIFRSSYDAKFVGTACARDWSQFERRYAEAPGEGQSCLEGEFSCKSGFRCVFEPPFQVAGNTFCGTCEKLSLVGEPCEAEMGCSESICFDGICHLIPKIGDACNDVLYCPYDSECVNGFCSAQPVGTASGEMLGQPCLSFGLMPCGSDWTLTCIANICVVRADLDEPCDSHDDCRASLGCDGSRCVPPVCIHDEGEACTPYSSCYNPSVNLWCGTVSGVCERVPELGESCHDFCIEGVCDPDTKVCLPLAGYGEPCSIDFDCASGVCQKDAAHMCTPDKFEAGSCTVPSCDLCGICVARPTPRLCNSVVTGE